MDASKLSFEQRVELVRLVAELRQSPPIGVTGLMEIRNLLGNLFPEFTAVRDDDLDDSIVQYITELDSDPVPFQPVGPGKKSS